ncbi:hypothetical protein AcW2_007238 [Taiwanofungus camphoratus]|nr:hypothetical protein AcW2_007238 [Antrodia cinnamomea]
MDVNTRPEMLWNCLRLLVRVPADHSRTCRGPNVRPSGENCISPSFCSLTTRAHPHVVPPGAEIQHLM